MPSFSRACPRLPVRRLLAVAGLVVALASAPYAQTPELEHRLKAAVVSKLPQFVEWPSEALDGRSTVDVCVAAASPVLTVGDTPRFLESGGIVALRTVQGKVRFEIDAGAARRVRLRISSQLLRLALAVRGDVS